MHLADHKLASFVASVYASVRVHVGGCVHVCVYVYLCTCVCCKYIPVCTGVLVNEYAYFYVLLCSVYSKNFS